MYQYVVQLDVQKEAIVYCTKAVRKWKPSGQPSMRRLPLSTDNLPSGRLFLLLRLHISSSARDAAAVQAARGLRAVRGALTGVAFRAIS
jgi:hypothetical protein